MASNDYAVIGQYWNSNLVNDGYSRALIIDTTRAQYQGIPYASLSEYQRRKFENLLVINNPLERVKFIYE